MKAFMREDALKECSPSGIELIYNKITIREKYIMKGFEYNSGTFIGKGAVEIFFQTWQTPRPRGVVVVVHGMGEHSGRYHNLVKSLEGTEINICSFDLRGHGKSGGKRGHIWSFRDYLADLEIFLDLIGSDFNKIPLLLLGHSLGGLICTTYVLTRPEKISGLIASSPFLILSMKVPSWKSSLGRILSSFAPSITMPTGLNPADLSHDNDEVESYENDPLVHDRASARWFTEVTAAQADCINHAQELTLPLLVIHGKGDKIADYSGSAVLAERAASKIKEIHVFEGLYHETMNETFKERAMVLDIVKTWILKTCSKKSPSEKKIKAGDSRKKKSAVKKSSKK